MNIFHEQVPHLRRFECDIHLSKDVEIIDFKFLRDLHPFLFIHLKYVEQLDGLIRIYT